MAVLFPKTNTVLTQNSTLQLENSPGLHVLLDRHSDGLRFSIKILFERSTLPSILPKMLFNCSYVLRVLYYSSFNICASLIHSLLCSNPNSKCIDRRVNHAEKSRERDRLTITKTRKNLICTSSRALRTFLPALSLG